MQAASSELDFEQAMEYRDLINSINHVAGNQKLQPTNLKTEILLHTQKKEVMQ